MIAQNQGLVIPRVFSSPDTHPFDKVDWEKRDAVIADKDGKLVFEMLGVEVPSFWSQRATDIVASKYFRVVDGSRETSVHAVIERVTDRIAVWGGEDGYFDPETTWLFKRELAHILLHQIASFNSPVWFNVGVQDHPQTSACFILAVEDNMPSIVEWYKQEAMIFKGGSGAGINLSKLRAANAPLSNGGTASGPLSFMRVADTSAGAMKSGGGTRRAATMRILNWNHPDIEAFISCKVKEELKAQALIDAGFDAGLEGEAYASVAFQNANHSVGVSDVFMTRAQGINEDEKLINQIACAAWACGDPGLFFTDTINNWHTCPRSGPITSSNPCSEFVFLDNSACNLASINLLKFLNTDGTFDTDSFIHTVNILITAMDILIDRSSYPTEKIAETSKNFRPLGLGYSNLGATLIARGVPYDSDEGREFAAEVTATMTAAAYAQSARLAQVKGPFAGFERNEDAMRAVLEKHEALTPTWAHRVFWRDTHALSAEHGFRNAQVTLLAPTGTISFMMDCETTGIEPCLGLVTTKKLVGGGELTMTNGVVKDGVDPKVYQCALGPNALPWQAHVRMVAAVQPHLSGSVSKTINMPADCTVEDVKQAYLMAWELGLKTISVYRDGCKGVQPVTVKDFEPKIGPIPLIVDGKEITPEMLQGPTRRRLPDTRTSLTHKFSVGGHEGYVTVGLYDDGKPAELFIRMAKEGSTLGGLMDALGASLSLALQHGIPLAVFTDKLKHTRFEPMGFTGNSAIPQAQSIVDYLARWLESRFISPHPPSTPTPAYLTSTTSWSLTGKTVSDTPPCPECGMLTVRQGSCCYCLACGTSTGCS